MSGDDVGCRPGVVGSLIRTDDGRRGTVNPLNESSREGATHSLAEPGIPRAAGMLSWGLRKSGEPGKPCGFTAFTLSG